MIATTHCIHSILNVPLQTADHHYTFFRIITLHIHATSDKFVQYSVDHAYFGIQHSQQTYLLLTKACFNRYNKGSIVICPADIAVFDSQTNTCESSLFIKAGVTHPLCQRKLIVHHNIPALLRYCALWIYQSASQHRVTLHCTKVNAQLPFTLTLEGSASSKSYWMPH